MLDMRQSKLSVVSSKIAFMAGMTLCVIPFFGSVHAQSSSSQAQVLFEMQELRQEIAQLRDMVERQQYELRKVKQELQTKSVTQSIPSASNSSGIETIELNGGAVSALNTPDQLSRSIASTETLTTKNVLNESPLLGLESGQVIDQRVDSSVAQINTSGLGVESAVNSVNSSVGSAVQSYVGQETQVSVGTTTQVSASETASNGRVYPPVDEIRIGSTPVSSASSSGASSVSVNQTDSRVLVNAGSSGSTITQQVLSAGSSALSNQAGQVIDGAQSTVNNVTQGSAGLVSDGISSSSLTTLDIKPIETIRSEPIISVPSSAQLNQPVVEGVKPVLDPASVVPVISESDYYQRGFSLLKESKHDEAVTVFKQQITAYPKGERADDAYYWIAESKYVNRKLGESKENFKAIIQGYPKSERLPDAMLKLAYIEQEQGNIIEARILLQEIMQFHPKSDAALLAKKRLAEIK